jgi:hypothetical protein
VFRCSFYYIFAVLARANIGGIMFRENIFHMPPEQNILLLHTLFTLIKKTFQVSFLNWHTHCELEYRHFPHWVVIWNNWGSIEYGNAISLASIAEVCRWFSSVTSHCLGNLGPYIVYVEMNRKLLHDIT